MKNELLGKLPPFMNKKILVVDNQQTKDIIQELLKGHIKYAADYDKISDQFWRGSVLKSCKYVFDFLKQNVKYKIEPDTRQSIKSPAAIIATGTTGGYNDCKHYSSFFGGLIDSWSRKKKAGKPINWAYRFANYKLFQDQPHHVFTVVKLGGKEYWCDAVLNSFNYQKPYVNKIDKKPNTMALYQISGVGCNDCGGRCQDEFNFGTPTISGRAERKARRQAKRKARRSGEDCKGRTGAKIALSPARNAFLALVKLNFRGFATKLNNTLQNPAKRLRLLEKWCGAGGSAKTLKIAISQGVRKRRLGMLGFAVASAIAAAAGIIALLKPFLGEKGTEIAEGAETALESGQQILENESSGQTTSGIQTNYIWGVAALAGIYLLTRKK